VDADTAQLWGLPANAVFYDPQPGYHTTLVRPDPSKQEYDFYTKAHVRYHFANDLGNCLLLQFIEEPNGNKIELYYDKNDPRTSSLPGAMRAALDGDAMTLNVIKDSSGRALFLKYDDIAHAMRIVEITGYDPDGTALGGLLITFRYDEGQSQKVGNL